MGSEGKSGQFVEKYFPLPKLWVGDVTLVLR